MKHVFIVNPVSGHGRAMKIVPLIHNYFKTKPGDYVIHETTGHLSAKEFTSRYTANDDACVYSVGGDGTAFEVLNGLNDGVRMAVIPAGTGNDFFRMAHVSSKDMALLLAQTIEGKDVHVDYGSINGNRIINTSSMGFDAQINNKATSIGKKLPIPSKLVYIVSALITLSELQAYNLTLELPDGEHHFHAVLIVINNGRWYGGGFQPTPMADIQDGYFDICVVDDVKWYTALRLLPKYMKGTHVTEKYAHFFKADKFVLKSEGEVDIAFDGEPIRGNRFDFEMKKGALWLRVPQHSPLDSNYPL